MKKILISQPKPSSEKSPYYDIEKDYGVECVFRPFFKVEGLTAKEFRQQKINLLDYTAVVFTSRHAIDNYFKGTKVQNYLETKGILTEKNDKLLAKSQYFGRCDGQAYIKEREIDGHFKESLQHDYRE